MVLKIEKNQDNVQFIFSNGDVKKISNNELSKLGIGDIKKTYCNEGDITDYSSGTTFTAEEIYYKINVLGKL